MVSHSRTTAAAAAAAEGVDQSTFNGSTNLERNVRRLHRQHEHEKTRYEITKLPVGVCVP